MRKLNERNKTYVYFMPFREMQYTQNSDGLYTGENLPLYASLVEARMVVGVNTGTAALEEFGVNDNYLVTAVTDDVNCTLNTDGIVWLAMGKLETYDEDTYVAGTPCIYDGEIKKLEAGSSEWRVVNYTHIVKRVAKSFGYITYLLKEVNFDYYPTLPEPTPSA